MRIEKSEKKVFITSETETEKSEVQLIITDWKIVLNGTFSVEELLEWLKELWYKQKLDYSQILHKDTFINDYNKIKPLNKLKPVLPITEWSNDIIYCTTQFN